MKKKLLIVVGAGASLDFGMPSVNEIDNLFNGYSQPYYELADGSHETLYSYIKNIIDAYYKNNPKSGLIKNTNFEEVLYQILSISSMLSDKNFQNSSNAFLKVNYIPSINHFGTNIKKPDGDIFRHLASHLVDSLVVDIIDRCNDAAINKINEINILREFLSQLSVDFDIGIVSLNYDNIFTQANPNFETGFSKSTGIFEPSSVMYNQWNFIYHLHGSVHFSMEGNSLDMHGIKWSETPTKGHHIQSIGRNSQDSMEGIPFLTSPIIAGYGKSSQILRSPFFTYFSQLERLIYEADSFLFLGYGFGDFHLNSSFYNIRSRTRPVAIIDWASDTQDSLQHRHDNWSYNLYKTIPFNAHSMSYGANSFAADISELKKNKDFEVSKDKNYPLSVWYDGMLSACQHADKVLAQLI